MGKLADAAKAYENAAAVTPYETRRATSAPKPLGPIRPRANREARQIWADMVNDPKGQAMVAEARIRLAIVSTPGEAVADGDARQEKRAARASARAALFLHFLPTPSRLRVAL